MGEFIQRYLFDCPTTRSLKYYAWPHRHFDEFSGADESLTMFAKHHLTCVSDVKKKVKTRAQSDYDHLNN